MGAALGLSLRLEYNASSNMKHLGYVRNTKCQQRWKHWICHHSAYQSLEPVNVETSALYFWMVLESLKHFETLLSSDIAILTSKIFKASHFSQLQHGCMVKQMNCFFWSSPHENKVGPQTIAK